ncbi:MAG: electron transport complex subunit RsxC [bacterium]|nr:electron transport complex subunit RsxC [bacterium]
MRLKTFRGGVHPPDCKDRTRDLPIRRAALPARVIIPLGGGGKARLRPLVEPGRRVLTGEKIAEGEGARAVPVHASISGAVSLIGETPVPYGGTAPAVEIEGDGRDEKAWEGTGIPDPVRAAPSEIIARIREAGIVGLGGAEFPAHVKLSPPPGRTIGHVIINGAECEPYLTADDRLMRERPGDVVAGARLLMRATGAARATVGIESNKREAREAVAAAARAFPEIEAVLVEVKYPQGAEKQLIRALLGREVPSGGLPADVGVVVQNAGTAVAVWEACALGKPLYERVVTVSGPSVREPANLLVRIGTTFADLLAQCGGLAPDAALLIMGGPMMGIAQWTAEVPVVKGTSGIIALPSRGIPAERPCIRCGLCLTVCPMGLSPSLIRRAAERGAWEIAERYGVLDCMECGACAYVCTTSRGQVQHYKRAKMEIGKRGKR